MKNQIMSINTNHFQAYLTKKGWIKDGMVGDKAIIWHRPEDQDYNFEVVQPIDLTIRGLNRKIVEAIEAISEFDMLRNFSRQKPYKKTLSIAKRLLKKMFSSHNSLEKQNSINCPSQDIFSRQPRNALVVQK